MLIQSDNMIIRAVFLLLIQSDNMIIRANVRTGLRQCFTTIQKS